MDLTLQLTPLLKRLSEHGVEFVIVGGVAATVHGSVRFTADLDVCAPLDQSNVAKIINALRGLNPRFRFRPDKMRMWEEPERFKDFKNLNLRTDWGVLDILGEVSGVGTYDQVAALSVPADLGGIVCRVLDLDALISAKRAANRPKDRPALIELQVIRERKAKMEERPPTGQPPPTP
jgi:hypothetical protein